ncbi:beta/alpha-amylase precursor [Clostridium tepidiprofundi DSM 19306]|uniref:Alpha-amylase n=1 Tax=Clostridium tepidiprofundi DSM 19306 TaxID=1121338 RepID=A0A151B5F8_9CLOT|nr:alpha-amylase family glycosyl hydrolase [Clostridium tepidiprofundi]KYH35116.1 beta/alpha-amylase precursor [Clostridium tepidiprofundi DSM 19306]
MKQKILILITIALMLSSGCTLNKSTPTQSISNHTNKSCQTSANGFQTKKIKKSYIPKYNVSNTGGNFSNHDLIYFIMTDRFYDGDTSNDNFPDVNKKDAKAYHGGDLKGIIKKLDYIKSLGTTAIWITPVVKNEPKGYHGYWAYDFYKVDPHIGTMDDFKNLVDEAHKRNIKVIMDYVVNHTGYNSPWLKDDTKKDWFHTKLNITNWSDQKQVENGWLSGLPDLNQENPEVRKYFIENALWWISKTNIDGMRLDTVRHVPKEFWNEFAHAIKEKYPNFYLLGEVWNESTHYLEQYHKLGIDGLTNYSMYNGIKNAFTRFGQTDSLINAIKQETNFSNPEINGIFIDNHDNMRLISMAGKHGKEYLKQALTFELTYPSIPIIYYGTEIGMQGKSDPDNRRDMEWNKTKKSDILDFYRKIVDFRNTNPALQTGDFKLLDYDSYFLSYMRKHNNSSVIVVMNLQNKNKNVTINVPQNNTKFKDLLTNKTYTLEHNKLQLMLKPLDLIILESN